MNNLRPILIIVSGFVSLALGIFGAFRLTSGALKRSSPESHLKFDATLSIPLPDSSLELDPKIQVSSNLKAISGALFSRLLRVNNAGEIEPDLASNWSFDFSRQEVIINIRPGVSFHDGTPLTIDDVVYSFELWLQKGALDNNLLFDIAGAEEYSSGESPRLAGLRVVNQASIAVKLKKAFTEDFIYALSTPRFYVYKKPRGNRQSNLKSELLVGTGPFKLKSVENKLVVLERFDGYFAKKALVHKLKFYSRDLDSAVNDLVSGQAHALFAYGDLPKDRLDSKNFKVVPLKNATTTILFLMNQGEARSIEFRRGIRSIFDIGNIQKSCFPGDKVAENVIPSGLRGSSLTSKPKLEKKSEHPVPRNPPVLSASTIESSCLRKSLDETLRRHGSHLREFPNLEELFQSFLAGQVDFAIERLTFKSLDPSNVLQYFNPSSNEYFLREPIPELQKMFQEAANSETALAKARVLNDIDTFLVQQGWVIPLVHQSFYTAYSPSLSGFSPSEFGNILSVKWEDLGMGELK